MQACMRMHAYARACMHMHVLELGLAEGAVDSADGPIIA